MNKKLFTGISILLLSTLACEPVIAIGWREVFIVLGLILFLFGPPLYRFIRTVEEFLKSRAKKDK
jgi:hypothetical protein